MRPSSDSNDRPMLRSVFLCAALLAGLACVSASPSARAQESSSGLKVTVMIYSGRPNPTFTVTDSAVIERLSEAYHGASPLEGFDQETVVPSILGYQGVRIENPRSEGGLPRLIVAYRSSLEIRNGGVRFLSDPGREIENTVIEQAIERDLLDDPAVRMIRQGAGYAQEP